MIPKEKLSAYQRWEMASFGDERPASAPTAADIKQAEEQMVSLREEARTQGYAAGFEQGRLAGLEAGRAMAQQETLLLQQIAQAFATEIAQANEVIAEDMLDLALDLTKSMMKTALAIRPQLVLPLVSEAIRYLPSLQQPALLFLHPDDAVLVNTHIGDELTKSGWRIHEDSQLERGGCRVETASNQIDASTSIRWQRIAAALGRESDWLE